MNVVSILLLILNTSISGKSLLAVSSIYDDALLAILYDMASLNHLTEQIGGGLAVVHFLFEAGHSFPKRRQLCQLGGDILLLSQLIGLVLGYLFLGPSPLAAGLHHVGRNAFRDYKETKMKKMEEPWNTYD